MKSSALPRTHQSTTDTIREIVTNDLHVASTLLALLKEEQKTIERRDSQKLAEIVDAKCQSLNDMEQLGLQRRQFLASLQHPQSDAAWKTLIEKQTDETIRSQWQALKDTLMQCRKHNEINGRLIGRSQQTIHQLLNIIRGHIDHPSLYDRHGIADSRRAMHPGTRA